MYQYRHEGVRDYLSLRYNNAFVVETKATMQDSKWEKFVLSVSSGLVTLVITPTISLMQDQTNELQKLGIPATYLGSAQLDPI